MPHVVALCPSGLPRIWRWVTGACDDRGPVKDPPTRILMISSEVESLARTGGLGDVVEALSLAMARRGAHVLVVTPRYRVSTVPRMTFSWRGGVPVTPFAGGERLTGVVELETTWTASGGSRRVCLVDDPGLFDRDGIYEDDRGAFGDNAFRFAVMSRAALAIAERAWDGGPDVIHAHDWHAAVGVIHARTMMGAGWARKPSVFTIHNLSFQGVLDHRAVTELALPRAAMRSDVLAHEGNVNLVKGAIALADAVTTVSPTYAREITTREGGFGLDAHLRAHAGKLTGILNGIDARAHPAVDPLLPARYDAARAPRARAMYKAALARELGLDPGDGPLFGAIARLTRQKGIDLVLALVSELVDRGARVVLVGQGDAALEEEMAHAAARFRGRVAARAVFDTGLSRRVYAGADFVFVPSRFEPCGLTQLYAMRYGAIPIVTNVGGLHDTVSPLGLRPSDVTMGTGFVARTPTLGALREVTRAALGLYRDRDAMRRVQARAMAVDVSWDGPAASYASLYASLLPRPRAIAS